jgi:hypothetical protein
VWGPGQIIGLVEDLGLPFQAPETIVGQVIAVGEIIDNSFGCQALIQFVAEILMFLTGTDPIMGNSEKSLWHLLRL